MPSIFPLDAIWEHTLTEILNHDNKSVMGSMIRTWVKHHKLDDFSSLFNHSPDKFTPSSLLSHYKGKADSEVLLEMLSTPLQELQNIRKYIQHLMDESDYDYDDDDFDDPLSEHNWLSQTRGKFMKYVIYNLSHSTESRPISNQNQNWLVSGKVSKEKKLPILHSRMKGILIVSAEVYTSLLSHMNVNKC